jgi:3-phenylpropionate/trans-cinnamate dioxygenase ferredoxin component
VTSRAFRGLEPAAAAPCPGIRCFLQAYGCAQYAAPDHERAVGWRDVGRKHGGPKHCVVQDVQASNLDLPISAKELEKTQTWQNFVEAAGLDQIPPGMGTTATVAGKDPALFNLDGMVYAVDDGHLHARGSGQPEGKIVTCRWHGWKYNATTGSVMNVPDYGVSCCAVKIVDGKVLVAVVWTANC